MGKIIAIGGGEISRAETLKIDRPLGSFHPKYNFKYEVNYGYLPGTASGDGEEIDAYILGIDKPLNDFTGKCIAVIHRLNDDDDKLIVIPEDIDNMSDKKISQATAFQEKFFKSKVIRFSLKNPKPADELLKCFNNKGKVIKSKTRKFLHTQPLKVWHGVSNVWLVNKKGQILCSKRASNLSGNPGKWQTYFGGHVKVGDSFIKTAHRELGEEIGVWLDEKKFHLIEVGKRQKFRHIFKSYAIKFASSIKSLNFQDGEIVKVKFFNFNDYIKAKEMFPEKWCNGIRAKQYKKILKVLSIA
ncbi:MAG: NUDIX domain-containing protein [Parcubacteria group bacterium]|nr:NUDIX domain-containing protein [Parcubacteria group bacterium]